MSVQPLLSNFAKAGSFTAGKTLSTSDGVYNYGTNRITFKWVLFVCSWVKSSYCSSPATDGMYREM
jgi:hypothetical protein